MLIRRRRGLPVAGGRPDLVRHQSIGTVVEAVGQHPPRRLPAEGHPTVFGRSVRDGGQGDFQSGLKRQRLLREDPPVVAEKKVPADAPVKVVKVVKKDDAALPQGVTGVVRAVDAEKNTLTVAHREGEDTFTLAKDGTIPLTASAMAICIIARFRAASGGGVRSARMASKATEFHCNTEFERSLRSSNDSNMAGPFVIAPPRAISGNPSRESEKTGHYRYTIGSVPEMAAVTWKPPGRAG